MTQTFARRTSYALLALAAVLAPVAVTALWAQQHLLSEKGYLATVAPLAADPSVQSAVSQAATDQIVSALPVDSIASSLPSVLQGVGALAEKAERTLVSAAVSDVVHSPSFPSLWVQANATAHEQFGAAMAAGGSGGDLRLTIGLDPIVQAVRADLVRRGVPGVGDVPLYVPGHVVMVTVPGAQVRSAHVAWALVRGAQWLAMAVVLLAAAAVLVAPRRRWMLLLEAVALLAGVGGLALLTVAAHAFYVAHSPVGAHVFGDALAASLGSWVRAWGLAATAVLAVAIAAVLGSSHEWRARNAHPAG
ncbi:MAG TPA: hypothetical protein VMI11_11730 [Actinomycetes bacterium]|nr:hypothetical protein [Actinomycetes bacterium]